MPDGVWTTDHQHDPYDVEGVNVDHEWHEGTILLPVAGPPGTAAAIVRLHAPYGLRKHHSYGKRTGDVPLMPDPTTIPLGAVLGAYTVSVAGADLDTDGLTRVYQTRTVAEYLLTLPRSVADGFDYPCLPFDGTGSAGNVVTADDFSATMFPAVAAPVARVGGGMGRTS
jgi:hypothetical protein